MIIFDVITTAQGAKRLLENRAIEINKDSNFINYIICPKNDIFTHDFYLNGIPFIPLSMTRGLNPIFTIKEIILFYKLLCKFQPDILHVHTSKAGAVARIASAIYNTFSSKKVYVCYQVHSFYFNALSGIKSKLFLKIEIFLSYLTDSILFQNTTEMKQAEKYKLNKHALLIYIGNGINLNKFKKNDFKPKLLPDWKSNTGKPILLICIARVEPKKNHRMLINSIKYLKELLIEKYGEIIAERAFKVICVGEIGDKHIIDYRNELNLQKYIDFIGLKDHDYVIDLLYNCHISVLTSIAEGKPRALIESMSCGIPCIATDVCGTNEVIINEKTGYLIPLNNELLFAKAILTLMENKDLYSFFSNESYIRAFEHFDEDKVIDKLKKIYIQKPKKV